MDQIALSKFIIIDGNFMLVEFNHFRFLQIKFITFYCLRMCDARREQQSVTCSKKDILSNVTIDFVGGFLVSWIFPPVLWLY